jgi:hypothetical protein
MMAFELAIRLARSEPVLHIQVLEAFLIAVLFGAIFPFTSRATSRFFKTRPWYSFTKSIFRDMFAKMIGNDVTDALLDKEMGNTFNVLGQHFAGGMLCAPAIFGMGVSREVALAMVRHGALIELGWEVQDTIQRLYERFCIENGSKIQPNGTFFMLFMHHAMQWAFVIPMNLYYSHLSGYHELIFMLEGAAAAAGAIGFYGYTLDTTRPNELLQMIVLNALNLVVMVYTRFIHYWWSLFKCLRTFYEDGAYGYLLAGCVCGIFLMPYIAGIFIPEMCNKIHKFTRLYVDAPAAPNCEKLPTLLQNTNDCQEASINKVHGD